LVPWQRFATALKSELYGVPVGVEGAKRWARVKGGEDDWRACFSAWWLHEARRDWQGATFLTIADDVAATEAGIAKYRQRLERLLRKHYGLRKDEPVSFVVAAPEERPAPANGEAPGAADGLLTNGEIPAADQEAWEQVVRIGKEHLARLARGNTGVKLEWFEHAVAPARLEAVEGADGKRVWKVRSPSPAAARVVLALLQQQPAVRQIAGDVAIEVLEDPGDGGGA
jgi:hypothetical protein